MRFITNIRGIRERIATLLNDNGITTLLRFPQSEQLNKGLHCVVGDIELRENTNTTKQIAIYEFSIELVFLEPHDWNADKTIWDVIETTLSLIKENSNIIFPNAHVYIKPLMRSRFLTNENGFNEIILMLECLITYYER